jgi:hypothetical protein
MLARVCAAAAWRAAAMTPGSVVAIALRTKFDRRGWAASLRHALLAAVCVLGAAPVALAEGPGSVAVAASAASAANTASPVPSAASATPAAPTASAPSGASAASTASADTTLSPRDAAVRQVVLGIVSFTHWPTPPVRVRLCVTGRPVYAHGLVDPLQAGTTPIDVQQINFDDPAIGTRCDVVYLGTLTDDQRQQVRAAVAGHPVLTISEHNPTCTAGSMFCLNVDAEHITFDVNLGAVARSGVRVHPNVLKLAQPPQTP